jgi:alpha-glucosidase (family GH31 glycosyl hydrolase)
MEPAALTDELNFVASAHDLSMLSPTTMVKIDKATGLVSFYNKKGDLLLAESGGVDNADAAHRTITFAASKNGDIYYGAGERGHSLKLNGDTLPMFNRQNYGYTAGDPRIRQMNITVPYFVSNKGYGVLFDDYNRSQLVLGKDEITYESDNTSKPISYYFINGNGSIAGASQEYANLTGHQELPPFWAMGYITSKYGYHTQAETLGAIDSLKTRGYPVDGIVLDLYWYGQETDMGRLEWNKTQFPDHEKMLKELADEGVNLVAISQPYINKIGAIDNYNKLVADGLTVRDSVGGNHDVTIWVGESGMFDVSNPATRQWLWDRYKSLTDDGIAGWWGDLGEPEVHPSTIFHANGETADQYHNVYGNEWSRIIFEGFKKEYPERRLMLLMRGGTAGLQRYNVFPWSTDVSRSWGGFQPQVNIMLNSGLSGLGYMSSDIGGFAVDPAHPTDEELYVRWLAMGAFTPTFRTHAQLKPEPYNYPNSADMTLKIIKQRYEWLPYNYTLSYENASKGYPLARPVSFYGNNLDEKYANLSDEYLWGERLLIAPVMTKGASSRSVVFPEGTWININNDTQSFKGGSTAKVSAPLGQLPMFVRASSFIPQYRRDIENVKQYDLSALTVLYYPGSEQTTYTLFDDDRTSPNSLNDNNYVLTSFTGQRDSNGTITISVEADRNIGVYDWMPATRTLTFEVKCLASAPKKVTLTEADAQTTLKKVAKTATEDATWSYNSSTRTLSVVVPFTGRPLELSIK